MSNTQIIFNGKLRTVDDVWLQRHTPGVRDLEGAFETMLYRTDGLVDPEAHYARLVRGLKQLGLPVPWTKPQLRRWVEQLIAASGKECSAALQRVRVMVWQERGKVHWGVAAAVYIPPKKSLYSGGVTVCLVPVMPRFRKEDGTFKALKYAVYRKALDKARSRGCFEAVLVDCQGRIIDGSRTNLILLTDRGLLTPPSGYGTLAGITVRRVLTLARSAGLKVVKRSVTTQDLTSARAAWLANSLLGLIPVKFPVTFF